MGMWEQLPHQTKKRVAWLIAKPAARHGGTSSWDLFAFDAFGEPLSVDCFHIDGPFRKAGMTWAEHFAIQHDLLLLGSWLQPPTTTGTWIVRVSQPSDAAPRTEHKPSRSTFFRRFRLAD